MENGRLPSSVRSEKAKLVYAHMLTKAPDLVMYGSGEKGWKRRRLRNWVQSFSNPTAHSKRSRVIPTIIWILTVWIRFEWIADSTSGKKAKRTGKGKERLRTKWAWRCFIFLWPRVKRESASEGSKRRIVYFLSYLEKRRNCALGLNEPKHERALLLPFLVGTFAIFSALPIFLSGRKSQRLCVRGACAYFPWEFHKLFISRRDYGALSYF